MIGRRLFLLAVGFVVAGSMHALPSARADENTDQLADLVDHTLAVELFSGDTELAPLAGDATYLRRVWLDLIGDIPTPEHVTAFLLDPDPNKRQRVVDDLVADPLFGQNWARYWRDVILYRRLEDRALIVANPLVVELRDQLNENIPWSEIASQFVTATGDVRENGSTAIIMAQDGRTDDVTAEVSRIFLGIQIQCAQCHDHPYDDWKREQFHELAAFFPRVAVRPLQTPTRRSFEVIGNDRTRARANPKANNNNRRGQPEHFMPDLDDPAAVGTKMEPKFFLTGTQVPLGTPDARRRGALAEWMTDNPWFAAAYVNRIWAELIGEGFYEPVDDMGPDRSPTAPNTIDLLSRRYADSGYDVKWLFRVLCATDAYQRESRPRRGILDTPMTANVAQPLRGDQLYNAILTALEGEESDRLVGGLGGLARRYGQEGAARAAFNVAFGYDPSDSRETVTSSIPQALAMMNSQSINRAVLGRNQQTMLGRLVDEIDDDQALVEELYLRTFSREPTEAELAGVLAFRAKVPNRNAAFEDILWALLNSSEFSHRR